MAIKRQRKMGSEGFCVCLKCGHREPHRPGTPCMKDRCPRCSAVMIREGSEHHRELLARAEGELHDVGLYRKP